MLVPVLESVRPQALGIYDPVLPRLAPKLPSNTKKRLTPSDFDAVGSSGPVGPLGAVSTGKMRKLDLARTSLLPGGKEPTSEMLLEQLFDDPVLLSILEAVPAGSRSLNEHFAALLQAAKPRHAWTQERLAMAAHAASLHGVLKQEISDFMKIDIPRDKKDSSVTRAVRAFNNSDNTNRWPRLLIAEVAGINQKHYRNAQVKLHAPDSDTAARLRLVVENLGDGAMSANARFRLALEWHDQLSIESEWHSNVDLAKVSNLISFDGTQLTAGCLYSAPYAGIGKWLTDNLPEGASKSERMNSAVAKIVDGSKPEWTLQQVARIVGVDLAQAKADHGVDIIAAQRSRAATQAPSANA